MAEPLTPRLPLPLKILSVIVWLAILYVAAFFIIAALSIPHVDPHTGLLCGNPTGMERLRCGFLLQLYPSKQTGDAYVIAPVLQPWKDVAVMFGQCLMLSALYGTTLLSIRRRRQSWFWAANILEFLLPLSQHALPIIGVAGALAMITDSARRYFPIKEKA